jgi:class 3 adenylate cyclase
MTRTNPAHGAGLSAGPHRARELHHISVMLGVEGQILAALGPVSKCLKDHSASSALLGRLRTIAEGHIEEWRVRTLGIGAPDPRVTISLGAPPAVPPGFERELTPSSALQVIYALVSQATFGYSILHVVAHRQCDSGWGIEEGNSADLAEEHLTDYLQSVEVLHRLVSDVTVWELSRDGLECRCVCPSCGLGICMCGSHGTARLVELWQSAMDPAKALSEVGISLLSPPRAESVALRAGLDRGDAIVGLDGRPVATGPKLMGRISDWSQRLEKVIKGPDAEEKMRIRVRRPSGRVQEVLVTSHADEAPLQERRLAAIMFTDMVGFTSLAQKDEPRAMRLLEEHRALVRREYPRFKGREIKTMGDGFLLEFSSALEAASCALAIQRAVRKRNQTRSRDKIQLRIGVHVGDLISVGGDIFGDAVNIASRIEPMAEPGGICVSQQVYDQVWNKVPVKMAEMAQCRLKNVSAPIGVYRVSVPLSR